MNNYYEFAKRITELYKLLNDEISRDIFWLRLKMDTTPSIVDVLRAANTMRAIDDEEYKKRCSWKSYFQSLLAEDNIILLYGARGFGEYFAAGILGDGCDFSGFCDDNYVFIPKANCKLEQVTLNGLDVISSVENNTLKAVIPVNTQMNVVFSKQGDIIKMGYWGKRYILPNGF